MAGGVGVRFWPYSRNAKPKQFLDVLGTGRSLLQSTYDRYLPICPKENIFVITHEEHAHLVKEQLPELSNEQILCEPVRKNTAPCVGYASYRIAQLNPDAVIVASPADHLIMNEKEFAKVIDRAVDEAKNGDKLITIGIKPTRPETGYGYIQFIPDRKYVKKVKTFTEKPELSLAKTFLESGDFVWNSGIFIWHVKAIIGAFENHIPEMAEVLEDCRSSFRTPREKEVIKNAYALFRNISIDYAIMEKASNVYVSLGDFAWSDLGSWASIHEVSQRDGNNNAIAGQAQVYETRNSIIRGSTPGRLIVVQGLDGYLVGEFGNVVIVCEKDREEQFRRFVNDVKSIPNGNDFL